jgi:hypothetical protein
MDHHCPWVSFLFIFFNMFLFFLHFRMGSSHVSHVFFPFLQVANCVGKRNRKAFILFLVWTSLACILYTPVALDTLSKVLIEDSSGSTTSTPEARASVAELVSSTATLAFAVVLSCFTAFHVHLVLQGSTTLERMANVEERPPTRRMNWESVFGDVVWLWFLPVPAVFRNKSERLWNGYEFVHPRSLFTLPPVNTL